MELYLIRHGETVDNVACLYAGVRDSVLTNHGVEQARRLGQHYAKTEVRFTRIFSSPLSRALKTAQAVSSAQSKPDGDSSPEIKQVPDLIEQDFGFYEGKPFHARSDPKKTGKESHREHHKHEPGFVDVESKEAMNRRADAFLDEHVVPLLQQPLDTGKHIVAVVSHGMLLSHLWRRLLRRLPTKSVTVQSELTAARGSIVLEHLGGWSNTGFLELGLNQAVAASVVAKAGQAPPAPAQSSKPPKTADGTQDTQDVDSTTDSTVPQTMTDPKILTGWTLLIRGIDNRQHLVGLKRQRGGIGRSAHDEGQKKLDGFFKRQRTS